MIDSRARALVYDVDLFQFGSCPMQLRLIVGWLFSLKKIFDLAQQISTKLLNYSGNVALTQLQNLGV